MEREPAAAFATTTKANVRIQLLQCITVNQKINSAVLTCQKSHVFPANLVLQLVSLGLLYSEIGSTPLSILYLYICNVYVCVQGFCCYVSVGWLLGWLLLVLFYGRQGLTLQPELVWNSRHKLSWTCTHSSPPASSSQIQRLQA